MVLGPVFCNTEVSRVLAAVSNLLDTCCDKIMKHALNFL